MMDERLRQAPCGLISLDHNGYIQEVNQTFLDWMDFQQEQLLGQHIESFFTTGNKIVFHSYFYPNINLNGHLEELFIHFKNQQGVSIPFLMNAKRFEQDGIERIDCILVSMKRRIDYELELRITKKQMEEAYLEKNIALAKLEQIYHEIEQKQVEMMEMNKKLLKISNTDKLTGIANRRFFEEKMAEHIQYYRHDQRPLSLLMVDIDFFKRVNDTYGHDIGDIVLIQLAEVLTKEVRSDDFAARIGGEEFVVILPNTDADVALLLAQKLNRDVERMEWKEVGRLTVSIGAATFTQNDSEETILKKADQALYASKENGRNRSTHYNQLHI